MIIISFEDLNNRYYYIKLQCINFCLYQDCSIVVLLATSSCTSLKTCTTLIITNTIMIFKNAVIRTFFARYYSFVICTIRDIAFMIYFTNGNA